MIKTIHRNKARDCQKKLSLTIKTSLKNYMRSQILFCNLKTAKKEISSQIGNLKVRTAVRPLRNKTMILAVKKRLIKRYR